MLKKKITQLLIGTNNKGKLREIKSLLPKRIKIYSPSDFKIKSPIENGKTFEENSLIKAKHFFTKSKMACLSDDSGLEVDLLNGKPGIHSARWGGIKKDFNLAIKKIFEEMKNVEKNWINKNEAKFICALTLFFPGGKNYSGKGIVKGKISSTKKGSKGFGYDPIFIPEGFTQTFGEMDPKLKMSIDHRFKAFDKIRKFFI